MRAAEERFVLPEDVCYHSAMRNLESSRPEPLARESEDRAQKNEAPLLDRKDDSLAIAAEVSPALIERLGLRENGREIVERAREIVLANAENPETALQMFEQALEYYAQPEKNVAETPVYHSTGSYGLSNILESGALSSVRNKTTGEQATTGRDAQETSLVIGGYDSSETVSYAYARLNEKKSRLKLDKHQVMGTSMAKEIVQHVYDEIPNLEPSEQQVVRDYIAGQKRHAKAEGMTDEEFLGRKMAELTDRKYYFDEGQVRQGLDHLKADVISARIQGKEYRITDKGGLNEKIANYEGRLKSFQDESPEMQDAMRDPFPVMLTYEGSGLPKEDLATPVSGLISERQTKEPIGNAGLKQIRAPQDSLPKVREWIEKRIAALPEDSPERIALENVEIVPLEFFEAKRIVDATAKEQE